MIKNINPLYYVSEGFFGKSEKPSNGLINSTKNYVSGLWRGTKSHLKGYGNLIGIGKNAKDIRTAAFMDAWGNISGRIIPGAAYGALYHIGKTWLFSPTKQMCISKLRRQLNSATTEQERNQIQAAIEDIRKLTPLQFKMKHVLNPSAVFKSAALGAVISSIKAIPDAAVDIHNNNDDVHAAKVRSAAKSMIDKIRRDRKLLR